jgi:hypothetical protein
MKISYYFLIAWAFIALVVACKKEPLDVGPDPIPNEPDIPTAFPIGKPTGSETVFTVTPAGGEYTRPDNAIKLVIPAGAVSKATTITLQPVENTAPAGSGQSIRLLPHGVQFAKPITIQFSYTAEDQTSSLTQALGLAYQDEQGFWRFATNPIVDKTKKTVSVTTTHFSDWTLANWFRITPRYEHTPEGGIVSLQVVDYFISSEDGAKDPFETIPKEMYMRDAKPLDARYIKNGGKGTAWQVGGPGEVVGNGSAATYTAPDYVNKPTDVSVSVELVDPTSSFRGQYLLIADITVTPKSSMAYRIGKGPWMIIPGAVVAQSKPGQYGVSAILKDSVTDEIKETVTILWRGGVGKHTWDGNGDDQPEYPNTMQYTLGYAKGVPNLVVSSWYMDDDEGWVDSGGVVDIEEMSNVGGYVKGTFRASQAGVFSVKQGKEVDRVMIEGYFVAKRVL